MGKQAIFEVPNSPKFRLPTPKIVIRWSKLTKFGPPDGHFRGQKARFRSIWGLKTACFAHEMATRGAPNVRNWVSDTDLVNIGQLDHYMVIGTKFGAIQDF